MDTIIPPLIVLCYDSFFVTYALQIGDRFEGFDV